MDPRAQIFEQHRRTLESLAYRMLGTLAEAEDVVQETYLKWHAADPETIRDARAWLVTVCSRLALNALKSARSRRESYVGPWLPEPFVDEGAADPAHQAQVDDTVSVALLLALEKLTPTERAAYLLHEAFDYDFEEIGRILMKSAAACRQLASRARSRLQQDKPRFEASTEDHQRLLRAFLAAAREGRLDQLKALFAEDVELHSDGGGRVQALPHVLVGSDAVSAFLVEIWQKYLNHRADLRLELYRFNGAPAMLVREGGRVGTAFSLAIRDGRIDRIYALRNPDKLASVEGAGLN